MVLRKIGRTYYLDIRRPDGTRIRKRASKNKAVAQRIHDDLTEEADRARIGLAPRNYSLIKLKDKFLAELNPRVSPLVFRDYETLLNMALSYIADAPPMDIRHKFNEYLHQRKQAGRSARTLNRTIEIVRRMFDYGVQNNLLAANPLSGMARFREQKRPRRALSPEEITKLLDVSGRWRPVWLAFLCTGLRKSELVRLCWKDIDTKAHTLAVRESKTDAGVRVIPIAPALQGALDALRKKGFNPEAPVFTTENGTPLKNNLLRTFRMCCHRAGINQEGLDLHALRYTFATLLTSGGVHPRHIQALLGHRSALTSLDIYAKVYSDDLRVAVKNIRI